MMATIKTQLNGVCTCWYVGTQHSRHELICASPGPHCQCHDDGWTNEKRSGKTQQQKKQDGNADEQSGFMNDIKQENYFSYYSYVYNI